MIKAGDCVYIKEEHPSGDIKTKYRVLYVSLGRAIIAPVHRTRFPYTMVKPLDHLILIDEIREDQP